jgi:hypothetical protein
VYARGLDILLNTYNWLDMTAKGRTKSLRIPWRGYAIMIAWQPADRPSGRRKSGLAHADPMVRSSARKWNDAPCARKSSCGQAAWQPHPNSMTLGQLCNHIAMIRAVLVALIAADGFDASQANFTPPQPQVWRKSEDVRAERARCGNNLLGFRMKRRAVCGG